MLSDANEYLNKLLKVHERSGLSYREVTHTCNLDPNYVHYILKGARPAAPECANRPGLCQPP